MGNIAISSPSKSDTDADADTNRPSETPKHEPKFTSSDLSKDSDSCGAKEEASHKQHTSTSSEITAWGSTTGKLYLSDPDTSPRGPEDRSSVTEFIMEKVGCQKAEKKDDGGEEAAESKSMGREVMRN